MTCNRAPILRGARTYVRKRARGISASLRRASCLNSLLPLHHHHLSLALPPRRSFALGVAWAFSYLLAPFVPSSLARFPGANSLLEDRAPIPSPLLPSSTALGARSIHGIASWFSEGSRLSPTTPDGAPLARSLSRCVFAYWLTHGATSPSDPLLVPSRSLPPLRPLLFFFPPLRSPSSRHYSVHCLAARLRSQPATRGPPVTQQ